MSDLVDQTAEREAVFDDARIAQIRRDAVLVPGAPGECDLCGAWSGRLVRDVCAPCRDKRRLP
jgi:hypothetical protein